MILWCDSMPGARKFKIEILRGDLTKQEADAIVNPASSLMFMGGGAAGAIRRSGGAEIEKEALKHAPLPVGKAAATGAGKLRAKWVIHAPTMELPAMSTTSEKVYLATRAALSCAEKLGASSVVMPGLGTGVGGVRPTEAAEAMCLAMDEFSGNAISIKKVVLCDIDEEMVKAWKKALSGS